MWKKLPKYEKKVFIDQFQEEKKKYDKTKEELKSKSEKESYVEEENKKNTKAKAKTQKDQVDKNNEKACNFEKCAECQKRKNKAKNPENEEKSGNKKEEKINNESKSINNNIIKEKEKEKPIEIIKSPPLEKNKDISQKNKMYKFIVGSRRLNVFGTGGKLLGAGIGALASAALVSSPILFSDIALGIVGGLNAVNYTSSVCDQIGALHVCILLGDDIFEYSDKGYARHKNVGKTSEYDWNDNFEIEGETKVNPDELEKKIIKSNEWTKDKYDAITHNCHSFVKFCCDIIEPDPTIMSVTIVNVPQCRLFRAW